MKKWSFGSYPIVHGFEIGIAFSNVDLHDECGRHASLRLSLFIRGFEIERYLGPSKDLWPDESRNWTDFSFDHTKEDFPDPDSGGHE